VLTFILLCLFYLGLPVASLESQSTISSITAEGGLLSPPESKVRNQKRKSPPSMSLPISCLNCFEDSYDLLVIDFEAKTVICKKCNHQAPSSDYNNEDFVNCLYDKKEPGSSGYKKHVETAYLSCLADVKRAESERMMITLKEKEMALQLRQQEQATKLQETQQAAQIQLMKMHTDATAAMHDVVQKITNKSPLEKYKEQKAAIAAMLAAGDIPDHVAAQLMEKLNTELLCATLI
jgi:hypothetical protein